MASYCKQLTTLALSYCSTITNAAVVAVASGCKQLTTLILLFCNKITDAAVEAGASDCKQAAHDAQPGSLRQHQRRGGCGSGLGLQATQVTQPV